GVVQQVDDAETVLTRPANDLVADLVGRDRGIRALAFRDADGLRVDPLPAADADGGYPVGGWRILIDELGAPREWVGPAGSRRGVGAVVQPGSSLRSALDS